MKRVWATIKNIFRPREGELERQKRRWNEREQQILDELHAHLLRETKNRPIVNLFLGHSAFHYKRSATEMDEVRKTLLEALDKYRAQS